jgi:D-xylose 1-dehydrogenase (NADP+, D-xylono-1,5-lactone-forming)
MMPAPPLRIGILGTANIARSFTQGVRPSKRVVVAAVASRDIGKAQRFAADLNIERPFGSYESLLADPGIDAVYIPLPNSLHAEWSIAAARAGKHILCEKPLAASATEARAMFDAAHRHGVRLAEGYPYLAQPQTLKMRELLQAGTVGEARLIQASFGFTLADPGNIRLKPQLAGGALMDVGVYPLSLIRIVAGRTPARVQAVARWAAGEGGADGSGAAGGAGGVDRVLAATLGFADGLMAQVTCSFESALHRQALIAGSEGVIQTSFLNHTSAEQPGILRLRTGAGAGNRGIDSIVETEPANGFLAEAESFARLVREGPAHWTGATPVQSIEIMMMLEAVLQSARSGGAVALP